MNGYLLHINNYSKNNSILSFCKQPVTKVFYEWNYIKSEDCVLTSLLLYSKDLELLLHLSQQVCFHMNKKYY